MNGGMLTTKVAENQKQQMLECHDEKIKKLFRLCYEAEKKLNALLEILSIKDEKIRAARLIELVLKENNKITKDCGCEK